MLKAIAANGLWSPQRLYLEGPHEDGNCRCGEDGTRWHWVWECPCTEIHRRQYGLLRNAQAGAQRHSGWPVWTHCLVPDPRAWLPAPRLGFEITRQPRPPGGSFEGEVYGDGSAFHVRDGRLRMAGWGLVQVALQSGLVHRTGQAYGPLPGLLQDSPGAEAMALLALLQHLGEGGGSQFLH